VDSRGEAGRREEERVEELLGHHWGVGGEQVSTSPY